MVGIRKRYFSGHFKKRTESLGSINLSIPFFNKSSCEVYWTRTSDPRPVKAML